MAHARLALCSVFLAVLMVAPAGEAAQRALVGHRRVGLGISYIPAHVRPVGSYRMPALLVRGSNTGGHFDLLASPTGEFTAEGIALHERTYKRYRENYYEQEKRHDEEFAGRGKAHAPA